MCIRDRPLNELILIKKCIRDNISEKIVFPKTRNSFIKPIVSLAKNNAAQIIKNHLSKKEKYAFAYNELAQKLGVKKIERIDAFFRRMNAAQMTCGTPYEEAKKRFAAAMSNDLGTPDALAVVFDLITAGNASLDSQDFDAARCFLATVTELLEVLGLSQVKKDFNVEIEELIHRRKVARQEKDFDEADRIRDELHSQGVEIEDTPNGTLWRYR